MNLPVNAGDAGSIPGSGRSPGEGNGNPFQYSCLENSMDRKAWWATVCGDTKNRHDLVTENSNDSFREFSDFREAESLEDLLKYILLDLTYRVSDSTDLE